MADGGRKLALDGRRDAASDGGRLVVSTVAELYW
jgi:hypothetical protein